MKTTEPLCKPVLDGFNCTVFAYGATGAGKTHTMIGPEDDPGVMYFTMNKLFEIMQSRRSDDVSYAIRVSFLEIYNEQIKDLINPSAETLEIREDKQQGIKIAGLTEAQVTSAIEVLDLL